MRIHSAAKTMQRGKDPNKHFVDLDDEEKDRAMSLVQVILMAELQGITNQNPLLSVVLDCPEYLLALKKWQADAGFSSQAKAVNAMLREIALRYGLFEKDEKTSGNASKRVKIGALHRS